jgi:N-acetylneuraminic acid mutarotase
MFRLALLFFLSGSVFGDHVAGHNNATFLWETLKVSLPVAISDHTATRMGDKVYIAGGCDSPNGNVWSGVFGVFICESVSSQFWVFDRLKESFTELQSMPTPRYRHAAVGVNNQIWLMGGRDVDDYINPTVAVYDIESDEWTSFHLPEKYNSSDLASFAHDNEAFFAGGYNYTYGFLDTVLAIDTVATMESNQLVMTEKEPLLTGRGDLSAATDDASTYALISGGFGSDQGFCEPLASVERYDFETGNWSSAAPLNLARSDLALEELNGYIFAIGGEAQVSNVCSNDPPEPGERTIPIDDVERFDGSEWTVLADLPNHRFRSAAVAFDDVNQIYTFGGQVSYSSDCMCFRTSSEVVVYAEDDGGSSSDAGDPDIRCWVMPLLVVLCSLA